MNLTRRSFTFTAAAALALPLSGAAAPARAPGTVLALYDDTAPAGCLFAGRADQRNVTARAVSGDRIRFLHAAVRPETRRIAGVTKYADFLLLSDVARELGFQVLAEMHRRRNGSTVTHSHSACADISLFGMMPSADWPALFADMALAGHAPEAACPRPLASLADCAGSAWILERRA